MRGARVIATDVADEPPELLSSSEHAPGAVYYRRLDVSRPKNWARLADWIGDGARARRRIDQQRGHHAPDSHERGRACGLRACLLRQRNQRAPGHPDVAAPDAPWRLHRQRGLLAALTGHYTVACTVSKWALRGLSRVASMELGPRGVRVNIIQPGYIEIPMTASAPEAFLEANRAVTPLGRGGAVDEVAPLVVFLISDESSFLSGAEIPVDRGSGRTAAQNPSPMRCGRRRHQQHRKETDIAYAEKRNPQSAFSLQMEEKR
jgi:3alpha(or 20beta)-hydroxysteroid dehydrogenase